MNRRIAQIEITKIRKMNLLIGNTHRIKSRMLLLTKNDKRDEGVDGGQFV